jgi:hypothetical protein
LHGCVVSLAGGLGRFSSEGARRPDLTEMRVEGLPWSRI